MRFRWKLLLLLLAMTLAPLVLMRTFGTRAMRHLGDELVSRLSENRSAHMKQQLLFRLESYSKLIQANRRQVEMALLLQSKEVEQALARKAEAAPAIFFAKDLNTGRNLPADASLSTEYYRIQPDGNIDFLTVSFAQQVFKLPSEALVPPLQADLKRLSALTGAYRDVYTRLHGLVLWHQTGLENGVSGAYPAHNGIPASLDLREQPWYQGAIRKNQLWSQPYIDPVSRQTVVSAAMPVRQAGAVRGVTALIVPVRKLLASDQISAHISPGTRTLMVYLTTVPKTGRRGIQIYAREEDADIKHRSWQTPIGAEWLISSDKNQYDALLTDLVGGKSNIRRMTYRGEDSLWAYGSENNGVSLVLITPYSEINSGPRQATAFVNRRITDIFIYTRYGLILLVVLLAAAAFAFSRTITRPLQALVKGARRLSEGHFDSRVEIRSTDEFKELGRVFNSVGPRLEAHSRMRQSLVLASEVQQLLIPTHDPTVYGLDIAGRSRYCDDTGGDYYDYFNIEASRGRIRIAVGDVSDHGISSALLMTTARALLRQRSAMPGDIRQVVADVNLQLAADVEESGRFMTLFCVEIDTRRKRIHWVRAGHDPALLYDPARDTFTDLSGKGLPLGVFENDAFELCRQNISLGQVIVIGTDGIWESAAPDGQRFGKERLRDIIRAHADRPAAEMIRAITDAVDRFRLPREQEDDITLVIVKMTV